MTDREKVIKGLKCCTKKACIYKDTEKECPYSELCGEYEDSFEDCTTALSKDALALLKAQEPRVMTLEEVQALCANDVVWLEDKGKPNIIPGIVRNRHMWPHSATMVTNFMRGDGCKVTADDDDYGKRWRCWTFCPTDAQREATSWED